MSIRRSALLLFTATTFIFGQSAAANVTRVGDMAATRQDALLACRAGADRFLH